MAKLAKEIATCASEAGVKNEGVQNYSVQYKGYNLIGVTTVERGDDSYASTIFFSIHKAAFIAGTVHYTCT